MDALPAVLSIEAAIDGGHTIGPTRRLARGDAAAALERADHVIEGTFRTGGQEHFYLETQAALAIPGEEGEITVHSSTQNPSEIQAVVAHCLGLRQNMVVCTCTRMGGGFGGKETQAAHPALLAALVAHKTGRPARIVYPRELDMRVTGKRHPYLSRYRVGFDSEGRIEALVLDLYSDGGCAADLSHGRHGSLDASCGQRLFYSPHRGYGHGLPDQPAIQYGVPRLRRAAGDRGHRKRHRRDRGLPGHRCARGAQAQLLWRARPRYHALRRSGGQQYASCRDRPACRHGGVRAATRRDRAIQSQPREPTCAGSRWCRSSSGSRSRGGRSTRANALVNIYLDGTIQVSTGGTEMGQGLNTKIRQIVADELALPLERGPGHADLDREEQQHLADGRVGEHRLERDGRAAGGHGLEESPCRGRPPGILRRRHDGIEASPTHIRFERGAVHDIRRPASRLEFAELVKMAYEERVDLGARGFYATPGVDFNRERAGAIRSFTSRTAPPSRRSSSIA